MKNFTSRLPLPVTVLSLAWAIVGSTLGDVIPFLGDISMLIALMLLFLVILKLLINPIQCYQTLKTSIGLAMFSSFSMSIMIIAVWMRNFLDRANIYVWIVGIVLHTLIFIIFTVKYILNFRLKNMYPTVFLVYSGFGIAAITCKEFGMIVLGEAMYTMIIYISIVLVPFAIIRNIKYNVNQLSRPLLVLYCVPAAIILSSAIVVSETISINNLWALFILVQLLLVLVIFSMVKNLFFGYYPTWSCYALAVSLSAMATWSFSHYMDKVHQNNYGIITYAYVLVLFALFVCVVVLFAYAAYTLQSPQKYKKKLEEKTKKEQERKRKFERNIDIKREQETQIEDNKQKKNNIINKKDGKKIKVSRQKETNIDKQKEYTLFTEDDISDLLD